MPTVPSTEDVRKAAEQARTAVTGAFEQVRTPLLAALGAGEVATQSIVEAINRARAQFTERAEAAKSAANELPSDVSALRDRLDTAELRKLVDQYADAAVKLYGHLAEEGEKTLDRLRSQPQFKRAIEQFDQAVETAQHRAESAVEDARELADEVLGRVSRRTRSTGEKVARTTEELAEETAETVVEAGDEAAHEVRGTARRTANRTSAARSTSSKPAGPTGSANRGSTTRRTSEK